MIQVEDIKTQKIVTTGSEEMSWDTAKELLDTITEPEPLVSSFGDIITVRTHWDCECEKNYIHPVSENFCRKCNSYRAEQPDSRFEEVKDFMLDNQRKIAEREIKDALYSRRGERKDPD